MYLDADFTPHGSESGTVERHGRREVERPRMVLARSRLATVRGESGQFATVFRYG
ncbi:MAG: hypothetical protein OIF51_20395 [Cellvibrionaceae bacterium]|nr:hypothetical protein [Cellvibrionaceae bacterium]